MSLASIDLTSLAWCLGEIRESMARARAALEAHLDGSGGDVARIREACGWLHQSQGALRFVGLEGVAVLVQRCESLLAQVERGERAFDTSVLAVLLRSFAAILEYLEGVAGGSADSPVSLFSHYRELMSAQGIDRVEPADLYLPDLSGVEPAGSPSLVEPLGREEAAQIQAAFERGLLGFLRNAQDGAALQAMQSTALRMQSAQAERSVQAYWRAATAFIDALRSRALAADLYAKRQVARIQQQLRKSVTSPAGAPVEDRMLREILFLLAQAGSGSTLADALRSQYRLENTVPRDFDVPRYGLVDAKGLGLAREATAQAKAAWERFVRDGASALADFATATQQLSSSIGAVPVPGLHRLCAVIYGLRIGLSTGDQSLIEDLSLEVATALLFIDQALDQGAAGFANNDVRASELADRIDAMAHSTVHDVPPMPEWLTMLSQSAQERLTTAAFVSELQANLRECEQALDGFFREPAQRQDLAPVESRLQQVSGALRLLGHVDAALGAESVAAHVAAFMSTEEPPAAVDCEQVAQTLGALGFFVESMRRPDGETQGFEFGLDAAGFAARLREPDLDEVSVALPSDAQDEAELMGIFLDEACEVLSAIESHQVQIELAPTDLDALVTVRRGFHTLKGSSRMVGLNAFGDVAWALEQTLNVWLSNGYPASAALVDLMGDAQRRLSQWTVLLRRDLHAALEVQDLLETAAALRGESLQVDAVTIELPPEPSADERFDAAGLIKLSELDLQLPLAGGESTDPFESTLDELVIDEPVADLVRIGDRELSASLYRIFLDEADQLLDVLGTAHGRWCETPAAIASSEALRAAHSLAGSSRIVGLSGVQAAARSLESFIEAQIGSGLALSPLDVDDFGRVLDRLRAVLHQFAAGSDPAPDAVLREHADALADRWRSIRLLADTELVEPEHLSAPTQDDDPLESAAPVLLDEIDADLLPVFVEEADELLPQIGEALREWSLMPQGSPAPAALMRHLHTVKGSARMAGAMRLGEAVHEMETRIELSGVRLADSRTLVDELIGRHDQVLALYEVIRDPHLTVDLQVTPMQPSIDADESSVIELPEALATAESAQSVAPTLIRVRADLLDRLVNEAGEVSIARSRLDNELTGIRQSLGELAENVIRLRSQLREIELAADTQIQARIASEREADTQFDPLEFDRYTRFQELTRLLAESVSDVATVHQNALRGLDDAGRDLARQTQVTRELQHDLMRIRMVRFGSVSDRLYRVVRQAAKELDKRVNLELEGADTEIDRSVLERMAGPIEHLLRNAVAHGIESRSQRTALGKAEAGEIVLRIRQDSNGVVIGLSDDGAGLDLPRIRARAIERGLIAPEAPLADRELSQLIFMPGFSTATEVTALAGRGVGMDVVRAEVAAMGGRIDLDATPGQGTRFTVHLPVSLAVTQIVLLTVGSTRIAVASGLIEQVMQIKPEALASAYEQHGIDWQGEAVPLYFLGSLLELRDARPLAQRYSPVVLLRSGHQRIALHVDHVAPSQEVVVKHVGPQLARLTGMAGATVLGNGDIVLILDPVQIAATGRGKPAGQGDTAGFAPLKVDIVPTVMVVDDSVTVRKVTQRLLVREGYQVMLARDGLDALRQVQDSVPDVMLLDIEMPRMDGFELAGRLRNDERLRGIPLVMISSRTADKHRDQAARLGVDAFLGKPFDEIELLEKVRELAARGKAST